MKTIMTFTLAVALSYACYAQDSTTQHTPVHLSSFPAVIDAVLQDFPNNLRNITGELVLAQGEFENYASVLTLPESQHCTITRWHSTQDTTVSWQATMLTTDNFGKADHAYREFYQKLQQCYIQLADGTIVYLKGSWAPARESASFTTSTLRVAVDDQRYKEVRVELELVYQLAEWGININIFSKKPDDEVAKAL